MAVPGPSSSTCEAAVALSVPTQVQILGKAEARAQCRAGELALQETGAACMNASAFHPADQEAYSAPLKVLQLILSRLVQVSEKDEARAQRRARELALQEEAQRKRVPLIDDQGRAYGTGKRKCSVARVWIRQALFSCTPENQWDAAAPPACSWESACMCCSKSNICLTRMRTRSVSQSATSEAPAHAAGPAQGA